MHKRTKLSTSLLVAFGGVLLSAGPTAQAQDAQKLERVTVTGSNIKRVEGESASPVQVMTRSEIERTGARNINEALQQITGAGAGLDDRVTNGFAPGGGSLNLRNLGFNSTLVLVNGRRLPTYPFAQQVGTSQGFQDLQNIPLAAVDRIDILKDGASAIYGADAVAGVVNIILRRDYKGFEVNGSAGQSSRGDGQEFSGGLTGGFGSLDADRFNVLFGLNASNRKEIPSRNRPWAGTEDLRPRGGADRRSSFGYPNTIIDTVTDDVGYFPGCGPTTQFGGSSQRANGFCGFDRATFGSLLPTTDKIGLYTRGTLAVTDEINGFVEGLFTQNKYSSTSWAAGSTDDVGIGTDTIPGGYAGNPFPNDAAIFHRFNDVGARGTDATSKTQRLVFGFTGTSWGWDWEAAGNYNKIKIDSTATNNALNSRLLCLTNPAAAASYAAGGDPLGRGTLDAIFAADPNQAAYFRQALGNCGSTAGLVYDFSNIANNSPAVANYLRWDSKRRGDSKLTGFDVRGSRELMQLAGGPLALALGAETRKEQVSDVPDSQLAYGDTLSISAAAAFGERRATAAFAELSAPFFKGFEMSLAVRRDKYSGNGDYSATSPKVGLRFQPTQNLLFRATASEAFRAPSLFETTPARQTAFTFGIQDPVLCPVFDNANPNCVRDVLRVQSGNPNLKPEKSKAYTVGVVFEPTDKTAVSVDLWRINRKDEIGAFDDQVFVNVFATNPNIVVRNASGQITSINVVPVQLNKTTTQGVDVELRGRTQVTDIGRLNAKIAASYVDTYKFTTIDDTGALTQQEFNGTYNQPRVRLTYDLSLNTGAWEPAITGYTVGGYQGLGRTTRVGGITLWNLSVGYTGIKNLTLRAAVNNLFDKAPSFNDETSGSNAGYNAQLADALGRFFVVSANYKF